MPPEPSTNGSRKIAKLPSAGVFENKSVAGFLKCSGFHEQSLSGSGGTGAKPPRQGIKERNSRRDSDCSGGQLEVSQAGRIGFHRRSEAKQALIPGNGPTACGSHFLLRWCHQGCTSNHTTTATPSQQDVNGVRDRMKVQCRALLHAKYGEDRITDWPMEEMAERDAPNRQGGGREAPAQEARTR